MASAANPASLKPRSVKTPARIDGSRKPLLDAAIELFAEHGYDGVSTGAVAKRAGLTQSMVHYYFGSKARLWEAAVEELMQRRGDRFALRLSDLRDVDPLSRLKVTIRRFVAANAEDPYLTQIIVLESTSSTARLRWIATRFMKPGYEMFNQAVQDCIDAGQIRPVAPADITNIIVGACALTFSLSRLLDEVYDDDSETHLLDPDRLSDTFIDVLIRGLEVHPEQGVGAEHANADRARPRTG
jgi:AcrR family transcriptional regulator